MTRFEGKEAYKEAARYAREQATRLNFDMALRGVKEYGRLGYNVGIACRQDSDYARAEIIRPGEPQS